MWGSDFRLGKVILVVCSCGMSLLYCRLFVSWVVLVVVLMFIDVGSVFNDIRMLLV